MSSDIYGFINDWITGDTPTADSYNDMCDVIDNQLGNLTNLFNPIGVLSGWEITAETDLNVSAGEGWLADAHCKTTGAQAITGITENDTLYYVFAQRKSPATGKVSASFSAGEVDFVANTSGTPPSNSILIATGTTNGDHTEFISPVDNEPEGKPYIYYSVDDTGAANTEFTIQHGLGTVPVGFLVVYIDAGGVVYDSGTAWTDEIIYLKCSAANASVKLYIW